MLSDSFGICLLESTVLILSIASYTVSVCPFLQIQIAV